MLHTCPLGHGHHLLQQTLPSCEIVSTYDQAELHWAGMLDTSSMTHPTAVTTDDARPLKHEPEVRYQALSDVKLSAVTSVCLPLLQLESCMFASCPSH